MVGRTNAGGGGGMKYLAGSFTSVKTTNQKTFTVAGLDFEPKLLIINRASYVNVKNNPNIAHIIWCDFERDIKSYVSTSLSSGYYNGGANFGESVSVALSKSGDTTTVTISGAPKFSGGSNEDAYGTYNYYFYG